MAQTQLDRIETKLDRLLLLFGNSVNQPNDDKAAIYAHGGFDALKAYMKAEADAKSRLLKASKI